MKIKVVNVRGEPIGQLIMEDQAWDELEDRILIDKQMFQLDIITDQFRNPLELAFHLVED